MKIIGQDNEGRLIIDLEQEHFNLLMPINLSSPAFITNGIFHDENSVIGNKLNRVDSFANISECFFMGKDKDKDIEEDKYYPINSRFDILDFND